jgi:Flp pilus assembly pilin Flp
MGRAQNPCIQGERQPIRSHHFRSALKLSPTLLIFLIVFRTWKCREVEHDRIVRLRMEEKGQDIAEYAVMLALILVLVLGTIRLVGSNANNAFSSAASSIQ